MPPVGRRLSVLGAALAVLVLAASHAAALTVPDARWLLEQVRILSAPEMEGRASGTPGADRAARHIAAEFQRAGLRPGGDAGGFLQSFSVPTGTRLDRPNALAVLAPAPRAMALGREFMPLSMSANGREEGSLVFAGYGVTAPDLGWDDYAGLDVGGKVVLVLAGPPRRDDPGSPFRRPDAYHYAERSHKVINAREHGARAVLLVSHPSIPDGLPALRERAQSWGVLAAAVTREAADALLAPAGRGLAEAVSAIDRAGAPASFTVPGAVVRLEVTLVRERGTAANVVGLLPGTDPRLAREAIVIGAHYDHLGRGGEGSLAPDQAGAIHPGADDNASGTAAVLGLARAFAAAGGVPRTLVFAAFAGEEMGMLGSTHYVRNPAHPIDRTVLMVNLDMVGRLRNGKLYLAGVDSGTGLRSLVSGLAGPGLDLQLRADPYAPSDHTPFDQAGRPVLFLFTGAHADYHRPSDTWDRIDARGLELVTAFAARVVEAVAREATPPAYVKLRAPAGGGDRGRGYGPFFGVVPEFGDSGGAGVRVGGVRPGSPADRAGVRTGDVVVAFAGMTVKTLEDLTFALRGRHAGDRVEVVVVRDGAERRLEAVLEERR